MLTNILLPVLGVASTLVLWINLSSESMRYGLIWFAIGVVALLVITRFLRKPMTTKVDEEEIAEVLGE